MIDKIQAGANIVISSTGTGANKKIRIDSVLGGQIVDEKVKISANDTSSSYLEGKIIAGDCIFITKEQAGLNEKLKVNIDWACALNKLANLPGFCASVLNCGAGGPQACPSITLSSPIVSGDSITISWSSLATEFDVYIDGQLQAGSPQSSTTFTKTGISNGNHTIEVVAKCLIGTPQSASIPFTINTNCPAPSNIITTYISSSVTVNWTPGAGVNSQSQTIRYRLKGALSWTTASNSLTPPTSSFIINGIQPNKIYEYQIINNCSGAAQTPSTIFESINIICPVATLTAGVTDIAYSFSDVAGDVTQYVIELLNNTGTTIVYSDTVNAPFNTTIADVFGPLASGTQYQFRITIKAGTLQKTCPVQFISTLSSPSCPIPSNLNVTVS